MTALIDRKSPNDCQYSRNEGEPAHGFILNASAMMSALETRDERVKEEGEEDHWNCHHDQIDKRPDIRPEQSDPD